MLSAFDRATQSHQYMLQRNGNGTESRTHESEERNATGVPMPSSCSTPAYVHHGYQAAAQELAHRKAAEEVAERPAVVAQPVNEEPSSHQHSHQPPQSDPHAEQTQWPESEVTSFAAAISDAQQTAHHAWQRASQASAQHAADCPSSGAATSRDPGEQCEDYLEERERPPQPPPPPTGFAWPSVIEESARDQQQPQPQLDASPDAETRQILFMRQQAEALGHVEGDDQLPELLMSWFHCGYQSGIRHGCSKKRSV